MWGGRDPGRVLNSYCPFSSRLEWEAVRMSSYRGPGRGESIFSQDCQLVLDPPDAEMPALAPSSSHVGL